MASIARISDIRGLVTQGESSEEILRNKDLITEHGGYLTIHEFAKIIFDDGRVIEINGPATFTLDASFFASDRFEDSITQLIDPASLDFINSEILEEQTQLGGDNNANQNDANADVDSEQLDTQRTDTTTEDTQLAAQTAAQGVETQAAQADATSPTTTTTPTATATADTEIVTPTIDLTASSDSGISQTDNLTNDTTPTFTGTGEPGSTVTLTTATGVVIGTATVAEDGTYTITTTTLPEGANNITVTTTDQAGNSSSANISVTIDTAADAGTVTVSTIAQDDIINAAESGEENQTISGTATGGDISTGDKVTVTVNGKEFTGTVDSDGNYSIEVPTADLVADNSVDVKVDSTDNAGNSVTSTASRDITVDTAVTVDADLATTSDTGISNTDDLTKDNTPTITGKTDAGATVVITDKDGNEVGRTTADSNGNYSITTTVLADGVQNLTITATDPAGNVAKTTQTVTVDTQLTQPTADIVDSSDTTRAGLEGGTTDNITADNTPTITGKTDAGVKVEIFDKNGNKIGETTADENGNYEITTSTLPDGAQNLVIKATDDAGNTSETTQAITVDTTITNNVLGMNDEYNYYWEDYGQSGSGGNVLVFDEKGAAITAGTGTHEGKYGTFTLNPDGSYTYRVKNGEDTQALGDGEIGKDTFTYTVTDEAGNSYTRSVTYGVNGRDDATVTQEDVMVINEDATATGNVLTNDSDVDDDLSVASYKIEGSDTVHSVGNSVLIEGKGTIVINSDGSYTFTPVNNYNGEVPTITYTTNTGATQELNITVNAVDDATVAKNDTKTVDEDTTASGNVLTNDTDIDSTLTVSTFTIEGSSAIHNAGDSVEIAGKGTLTINSDGSYSFTPAENYNGEVPTITYTTNTGATAELDININAVDDATIAKNDTKTIDEDTTASGNVLTNDTDVDSSISVQTFTIAGTSEVHNAGDSVEIAGKGTIVINSDGSYTFTPIENYNGDVPTITYTTNTGASANLDIDITAVNDAPIANDDGNIVTETVTITSSNMNDTNNGFKVTALDPEGNEAELSTGPYGFGVKGSASGDDAELGYKAGVGSEKIKVEFNEDVSSIDVAFGWKGTGEDAIITFYKDGVVVGTTVSKSGNNVVGSKETLKPDNGAAFDSVVFSVPESTYHDYLINSISFEKATSDITTDEDTAITVDVLANDTDVDGDKLSIQSVESPVMLNGVAVGTAEIVTVDGKQQIKFTPNDEFDKLKAGEDQNISFDYTVTDGSKTDTATVKIKVEGTDDVTVAVDDTKTIAEDTSATGNVLTNDSDVDTTLTVQTFTIAGSNSVHNAGDSVAIAGKGTIVINSDGSYTFTPVDDFNGDVPTISYTTNTGASANLDIDVTAVNDGPTATAKTDEVNEDSTISGKIDAQDVDGDTLTFSVKEGATTPTGLTLNSDGTYTFDASSYDSLKEGQTQTIEVPITISDGKGGTTETTLTIDVKGQDNDLTFQSESAGYKNVVGYYELDNEGNPISPAKIVIDDQNGMAGGTHLADLDASKQYGFFIIPNGANLVNADTEITFDTTGDKPQLVINGNNSNAKVMHDNPEFNADNKDYFKMEDNGQGGTRIKIEDIPGGGDKDYNDVILNSEVAIADKKIATKIEDDTKTVDEDTTASGNVLSNDTSADSLSIATFTIDGDTATHNAGDSVTIEGKGTLTMNANGSYTFEPVEDYSGEVPTINYNTTTGETGQLDIDINAVADDVNASIEVTSVKENTTETKVVNQEANEANGIYERDGKYYKKEIQQEESQEVDIEALRAKGYTIDQDGKYYEINNSGAKVVIEKEVTTTVKKVVDAEPIMKVATEDTVVEVVGEEFTHTPGVIQNGQSVTIDLGTQSKNIELDFNDFDDGTLTIEFLNAQGEVIGTRTQFEASDGTKGYGFGEEFTAVRLTANGADIEVETLKGRGPSQEITVEAGGLIPDTEAMEEAGITWNATEYKEITQTQDINNIGNVGNGNVRGFNPEDHETSQVFDFGEELANRKVTITVDLQVKGSWDNNAYSTNDFFTVSANGKELDTNFYSNNYNDANKSDDIEHINYYGTSKTYQYEVYLDDNGQVQLDFMVASTASNEIVNIKEINVIYEGDTGYTKTVEEIETSTESVLVDAPNREVDSSEIPGGVPMKTVTTPVEVEVETEPIMSTTTQTESFTHTLDISASLTDLDGSETLTVTLEGIPAGVNLDNGTKNSDGTWTIEVGDALAISNSINMTIPEGTEDFTVTIKAVGQEKGTNETKTVTKDVEVDVDNVTEQAPTITATLGAENVINTGDGNVDLSMNTWDGVDNQYTSTYNNNLNSGGDFTQNNDDIYIEKNVNTSVRTFNGDDEVYVGGNVNSNINLGNGNNEIEIEGNLSSQLYSGVDNDTIKVGKDVNSQINSGSGDDTILVGKNAKSQIDTGDGNDSIFVNNKVTSQINTGDDNDTVKVGGKVESQINLGSGNDVIQVGGKITSQIDGGHGTDSIILDNYTKADWDSNKDDIQTNVHDFENIKFSDGQTIGDASAFDSIGAGTTTYEYPVTISASNDDSLSSVKIVVENLPEGAKIIQNGVEISVTNGNEYVLNTNDLSNVKISSPTQIASDGEGGLKISVEATTDNSDSLQTAVLVDGVVEGIYYETSSGVTGYTDANGNFNFREGDSITFKVGGVTLGVATAEDVASGKTFLQDIADVNKADLNDEYLENMAVFLQSIDTPDSGDNIVITQQMHEKLKDANIDLRTASEEEVQNLVESVGGTYVDENDAMQHVKDMLQEYTNMQEKDFDERVEDTNSATLGKEPLAGVEYETSSGVKGITNEDGTFEYNENDTITFSKDGEEISTIDSKEIGDDNLITMNELKTLDTNAPSIEDSPELDLDKVSAIADEENEAQESEETNIEDLEIKDMLIKEEGEDSISNLLGEDKEDNTTSSENSNSTSESTTSNTNDDPFSRLEESSSELLGNMDNQDVGFDDSDH